MNADLNQVDPKWAWQPYEPTSARPWTRGLAAHSARRAGFGLDREQLDAAVAQGPAAFLDGWFAPRQEPAALEQEFNQLGETVLGSNAPRNLSAWWLYRMLATPAQLCEKMTLFWHGHFASSAAKVTDARLMYAQNQLFRKHALGDFAQLAQDISRDPAMLLYLDSATNRKAHANENYGRELMELFCLGEGNYTEKDVQELARCFTGWEVRRGAYRFNRFQHDEGTKTVLGQTGAWGGEDGVRIVLAQPACPRFITRKLVRYLVLDEPDAPDRIIEPLVREFREKDLQIAPLVRRIVSSQLFFSPLAVGRKVRSPVELAVGLLRVLQATTDNYELANELEMLGQGLFFPPNVKGWDGGRAWINSSTLLGRANTVRALMTSSKTRFGGGTLADFAGRQGARAPDQWLGWLEETLLAVPLPSEVRSRILDEVSAGRHDEETTLRELVCALAVVPEFQLS